MTDRINALTVVLDKDIRADDVEYLKQAISMIRGVLRVDQHVSDISSHIAYARARADLQERLFEALREKK